LGKITPRSWDLRLMFPEKENNNNPRKFPGFKAFPFF
jgi:hypothetical protein